MLVSEIVFVEVCVDMSSLFQFYLLSNTKTFDGIGLKTYNIKCWPKTQNISTLVFFIEGTGLGSIFMHQFNLQL